MQEYLPTPEQFQHIMEITGKSAEDKNGEATDELKIKQSKEK